MIAPDLYYKTTEDIRIRELDKDWHYKCWMIPKGFRWDGASCPRILWSIISPWRNPKASCLHDFLCGIAIDKEERKQADIEFKILVGAEESKLEKLVGYAGVRLGAFFGIGNNF